jgi:phosphatidate cytidylyltransferase
VLKHRLISGLSIGALVVLAAWRIPPAGAWAALVAVAALGQWEFYGMIGNAGIPSFRLVGLACGAALITTTFLTIGDDLDRVVAASRWEQFVLLGSLVAVLIRLFPQQHNDKPLATVACTMLGIWYVPYLFNFMTRLLFAWDDPAGAQRIGETGRRLFFYGVIVVKTTDMGAYFTGRLIGRHKLIPRISPAKTWEGVAGGVLAAVAASLVIVAFTGGVYAGGRLRVHWHDAVILGVLLAVMGIVGDLFESLLKRASNTKDSGTLVPGMGGILDVIDSLLFGIPALYVYLRLFVEVPAG